MNRHCTPEDCWVALNGKARRVWQVRFLIVVLHTQSACLVWAGWLDKRECSHRHQLAYESVHEWRRSTTSQSSWTGIQAAPPPSSPGLARMRPSFSTRFTRASRSVAAQSASGLFQVCFRLLLHSSSLALLHAAVVSRSLTPSLHVSCRVAPEMLQGLTPTCARRLSLETWAWMRA